MKKQIITGLLMLLFADIQAQQPDHSIFINAGGGIHTLSYDLQNGKQKRGAGFIFDAGYNYFFSSHWGLETGLGVQSLQSVATVNYMTGTPATDTDGDTYEFRTYYKNWEEKQTAYLLDIPLGVRFRKNITEKLGWTASIGAKVSLPVSSRYKVTGGEITTTGYYSQWNVELADMPQHGFTTIAEQFKGSTALNPSYSGYVDLGALCRLSSTVEFYAGAYVNYGLNNMVKTSNNLIYQKDGVYNGVLNSDQVDKVHLVSFGLKVGLRWNLGHKKTVEIPAAPTPVEVKPVAMNEPTAIEKAPVTIIAQPDSVIQPPVSETISRASLSKDSLYTLAKTLAAKAEIKFALNTSVKPTRSDTDKIKALSELLKANPDMELLITGHTCNMATRKVNLYIGMERAKSVKELFLQQGVPEKQLHCQTKAFDEPLVPNTSEENRAQNRRVELKLLR